MKATDRHVKNNILFMPSHVVSLDVFQWKKNINPLVNRIRFNSGTFYRHIWLLDDFPGIYSCLFLLFCFLRGSKCYADSYLSSRTVTAVWQDCEGDLIPQSLVYWQPFSQACLQTLNRIILQFVVQQYSHGDSLQSKGTVAGEMSGDWISSLVILCATLGIQPHPVCGRIF